MELIELDATAQRALELLTNAGMSDGSIYDYLSAYMGHAQLSDTYYYIHLVPGLLEEMSGFTFSSAEAFLPEVGNDE